jgi:small conductance mechanosensitive channel
MYLSEAWAKIQDQITGLIAALPMIGLALIIFAIFFLVGKQSRRLVTRITAKRPHARNVGLVLGRLSQGLVILLGLLVALSIALPEFGAGQLIEVLGIGGVAVGFAFRDILQNFLAGILLLLTEPFGIGDQIIVNDFEGTVEDIQTRATFIKTYDGRRVVIPNSDLFIQSVTVNTAFASRRSEYDVRIGRRDDIEQAQALIVEALKGVDGILQEPAPDVYVVELADSSVNLRVRWWTKPQRADVVATHGKALAAIKQKLLEHGIDLPFPTQQILFHDQTEETDGNRLYQREGWPAGKHEVPPPRPIGSPIAKELSEVTELRTQRNTHQ